MDIAYCRLMARVLLLEDDPRYRDIIERVLSRNFRCTLTSVATEKQAWEELSSDDFDLVLLDLYVDGRRCWETLRRAVRHRSRPAAIVFSCEDTRRNADDAESLGAYAFLSKPFDFVRLKNTIESVLRGAVVLVVGPGRGNREPLRNALLPCGFRVMEASGGPTALEMLRRESVDIILVEMKECAPEALDSCRFLREHRDRTRGIPVLAVTDPGEEAILSALRAGADDFYVGPAEGKLLVEKVKAHIRLRRETERRVEREILLGARDPGTVPDSAAWFRVRLKEEIERSLRYKKQLTLALLSPCEPGQTKGPRDSQVGDPFLAVASRAIRRAFRGTDIFGRCEENEIAVLLPETRADQVIGRINDLRETMEGHLSPGNGEKTGIPVRAGLASLPFPASMGAASGYAGSPEDLFRMARVALDQARAGEDRPVAIFGT